MSAPVEGATGATAQQPVPDIAQVETFWKKFARAGEVYEVRVTDSRRGPARLWKTCAGYFVGGDPSFVTEVSRLTGQDAQAVYITVNPVRTDLLARGRSRLVSDVKSTAADTDIIRRRHFYIDVDSKRPAGISATDEERDAALKVRDSIKDYLEDAGWPAPLYSAMSGNGGSLMYEIDLPNDDASTQLISDCLAALAHSFETDAVSVDQTVSNAARLTKIPGTIAAKGDHVPEIGRIWRVSRAEFHPDPKPVTRAQMEALAALAPRGSETDPTIFANVPAGGTRSWSVTEVLKRNAIGYFERRRAYGTAYVLDRCLTATAHTDGAAILERADGGLGYRCHHNSCSDKGWQDVREALGVPEQSTNGRVDFGRPSVSSARPLRMEPAWPDTLNEYALYGLLGAIVRAIEPYSEADSAALLAHAITGTGVLIGPNVYAVAGDARHPPRFFTIVAGETSKGRKGSAARPNERLLVQTDQTFAARISEGLSSGEGLIWQVRDAIYKMERRKGDAEPVEVLDDPGISDKRLWLIESELASTLRVLQREGNTLSALVRRAWDTGTLATLTKNSPARATGAHIGITGHISKDELLRYLDRSELASGFVNRFLVFASRRARVLPDGEAVPAEVLEPLVLRLKQVQAWAATSRLLRRDKMTSSLWHQAYGQLSEGRPGMFGAATNRAEAQVLRLSVLYAALDCAEAIRPEHLLAAVAVWRYAEQSARWVFGDAIGDPIADTILAALRQQGSMNRTDIYELFGRNVNRPRTEQALALLTKYSLATRREEATGGRPREVWRAT